MYRRGFNFLKSKMGMILPVLFLLTVRGFTTYVGLVTCLIHPFAIKPSISASDGTDIRIREIRPKIPNPNPRISKVKKHGFGFGHCPSSPLILEGKGKQRKGAERGSGQQFFNLHGKSSTKNYNSC